jgi:hypothetical protein
MIPEEERKGVRRESNKGKDSRTGEKRGLAGIIQGE